MLCPLGGGGITKETLLLSSKKKKSQTKLKKNLAGLGDGSAREGGRVKSEREAQAAEKRHRPSAERAAGICRLLLLLLPLPPAAHQRLSLCFLCVFPVCLMSGFWGHRVGEGGGSRACFLCVDGCQARDPTPTTPTPQHGDNSHRSGPPMSVTGGQAGSRFTHQDTFTDFCVQKFTKRAAEIRPQRAPVPTSCLGHYS